MIFRCCNQEGKKSKVKITPPPLDVSAFLLGEKIANAAGNDRGNWGREREIGRTPTKVLSPCALDGGGRRTRKNYALRTTMISC